MMKLTVCKKWLLAAPLFLVIGCGKADDAGDSTKSVSQDRQMLTAAKADNPASASAPILKIASTTGTIALGKGGESGNARTASLPTQKAPQPLARQVIRHADLDVRVENVEKAEKSVNAIVQSVGGYTETASSSDLASVHPVLTIALRVPVGSFDDCIAKFEALGVRLSKKIGSEDVTGQLVDLDARLKTLHAQEDVFRDMLKNRSQLDEVFNIQNQLTQVRTQIEEISGQRKTQAGLAALSTVALTLEQNAVANVATTDPNWFAQTWGEASSGASFALRTVVVLLVWGLAFSPFWIPVLLVIRKSLKPAADKRPVPPIQF